MQFRLEQLETIAAKIIQTAQEKKTDTHATVITFSGDLGAGKTTLVKEIARQLGVQEGLSSPTFVIYKIYSVANEQFPWQQLIHGDMYRLESAQEIELLGWQTLISDSKNIILIEWPEKVQSVIPDHAINVALSHRGEDVRNIDIE